MVPYPYIIGIYFSKSIIPFTVNKQMLWISCLETIWEPCQNCVVWWKCWSSTEQISKIQSQSEVKFQPLSVQSCIIFCILMSGEYPCLVIRVRCGALLKCYRHRHCYRSVHLSKIWECSMLQGVPRSHLVFLEGFQWLENKTVDTGSIGKIRNQRLKLTEVHHQILHKFDPGNLTLYTEKFKINLKPSNIWLRFDISKLEFNLSSHFLFPWQFA